MDGQPPHHDAEAPQLRTLLLTDLCDSTQRVEELGDAAAAALFRDHDRLVLELQQRWRGRLIDRSDGMLLIFERPLDGLGFALDYRRGLEALGQAHRSGPLLARAGLHVGEVLVWRNSEEAVSAGAKPVEVEGLAKPFAARLMQLARPGQILLSSVAEPLVRRAARELGDRGQALQWRAHGRWYFKGVPEVQEIHEVGEPGLAPLRMPHGDGKARRDLPAWRRPMALAAETVAVVGLVTGMWFMTRPAPAIAFSERDWVVVGDLRNLTGDGGYDGAIEAALRTGLEQSQFVNVVPDARVQNVLALMESPGAAIDRGNGVEVAQRTGARMLLLPTVSEVGGKVRVDVDVVDPTSSATVLSVGEAGRGADSAIHSTGEVAETLRARLGESATVIARSSMPLEQVTTSNLEALRAFTLGQRSYALRDFDTAEQHFRQALRLDPAFAMARIGLARVAFGRTDLAVALEEMKTALSDASRLTDRERLYADAQLSILRWEKDYLAKWRALSDLYPDFDVAAFNTALGMSTENRFKEMHESSSRAIAARGVTLPVAMKFRAIANAGLGDLPGALADCAQEPGKGVSVVIECEFFLAANGAVDKALAGLGPTPGEPAHLVIERATAELNVLASEGRWQEAEAKARALIRDIPEPALPFEWFARTTALSVLSRRIEGAPLRAELRALLDQAEARLPQAVGRGRDVVAASALHAGYIAAGIGDLESVARARRLAKAQVDASPNPLLRNSEAITAARAQTVGGDPQAALATLAAYRGPDALALTWVERARAQEQLGQDATELRTLIASPAGKARAYAEWGPEKPPPASVLAR